MWLPVATCEKPLYGCGLFSTRSLRLPRFMGIGAHKAGTSWLHVNLQAHPQLFLPRQKELHYFDSYFHSRTLRFYSGQFESADAKIRGEITPAYSILSPKRIRFIRKIMPDVRLIFIMRNPIDRSWSAALMDLLTLQIGHSIRFRKTSSTLISSHKVPERETAITRYWTTGCPSFPKNNCT